MNERAERGADAPPAGAEERRTEERGGHEARDVREVWIRPQHAPEGAADEPQPEARAERELAIGHGSDARHVAVVSSARGTVNGANRVQIIGAIGWIAAW